MTSVPQAKLESTAYSPSASGAPGDGSVGEGTPAQFEVQHGGSLYTSVPGSTGVHPLGTVAGAAVVGAMVVASTVGGVAGVDSVITIDGLDVGSLPGALAGFADEFDPLHDAATTANTTMIAAASRRLRR